MFSLGVAERSWDEDDERVQKAQQQQQQQQQSMQSMNTSGEYGMGSGSALAFAPHMRGNFAGPVERQRLQPFIGGLQSGSQQQPSSASWSRYTALDFELLLHEGKQPTEDMRRSVAYMRWYNSKRLHESQLPPPLTDTRQNTRDIIEEPWEGTSTVRMTGRMNLPGGGVLETGKGAIRLELDAKNLQQSNEQHSFNPYAAGFQHDNMLSPGTQFFGAYAPTPLATMATPNTLRAYAHSRMGTQNSSVSNNNERDVPQAVPPVATQPLYTEWNSTADFCGGANALPTLNQQYYTQEPMNPFDYYTDSAVTGYYNAAVTGMPDTTHVQPAFVAMGSANDPGMMQGAGGRGRRGGAGSGGRGRGASGGKWNPAGVKPSGRGVPYSEPLQPRSARLEEFRVDAMNGTISHWRISHILGYAVEFAQDQEGSRFIQRAVESATHDEVDALFHEIFESPLVLVTDIFGNYVLQKLLEVGNARQLAHAATRLQNNVVSLTLQTYGCRVIQKCIEVMPPEGLDIILAELKGNVAKCIQDQNGNHVVQKCVEVTPQRCGFIVSAFTGRVMELATHAYGCRVIQCIMQHCPDQEEVIFSEILKCVDTLAKDQYGNYVIQHVLQHMKDENKVTRVFNALKNDFYEFSKQKFASNVMEKIFVRADPQQRMELIQKLCAPVEGVEAAPVEVLAFKRLPPVKKEETEKQRNGYAKKGRRDKEREREKESAGGPVIEVHSDGKEAPSMLCLMMQNPFANYVAQRVLDAADVDQFWCLVDNIQKYLIPISSYTYGAPIVQRLVRRELVKAPDDLVFNLSTAHPGSGGKGNHPHHRKRIVEADGNV
ncbi:pumilio protein, putative [Trypanosoma cruzi marinkellei]|uniref:Pumilio protein, putative n=1 Tax=Trypanosoma cruzi marinkellei TaxID=85056 RepID=K2NFB7_TRYCR|nr:pumilio protein, putative [Trypanosoma cruzi marinkellei]